MPVNYPITSLVPREESSALDKKISYVDTKADANAAMYAVSNILLPLLPLLSGHIQDLVLIMKKFFTIQSLYENISYLFAFRLADDSDFESLVNDLIIFIKRRSDPLLEDDFLAFVKFLREEVKPLV